MREAGWWSYAGVAAALLSCGCAAKTQQPASPLTSATDFYGARIGMTREEVVAHAPTAKIAGQPCTIELADDPKQLFLRCGAHRLSADFTAAGKAWWLRASYDLSGTDATLADARGALVTRYGAPTGGDGNGLAWLPPGTPAAKVPMCVGAATLMVAVIELRGSPGADAGPLPEVDPTCLPLRSAILADQAGHRGIIVEAQDSRPRLAELSHAR